MPDATSAQVVATMVSAAASGAATEAGREAWTSLIDLVRRCLGRSGTSSEEETSAPDPHDPEQVRVLIGTVLEEAGRSVEFAAALRQWLETTGAVHASVPQSTGVHNEVTGNARVGTVVQTHTVNGGISLGNTSVSERGEPR
ncbi:hypothetical protein ABZ312_12055 [Streptomyces sp. NPDC006207]